MPRNFYYLFSFTVFVIVKYMCNAIKFNNIRFSHFGSPVFNNNNNNSNNNLVFAEMVT
jgi:hypothetical protein